jgi:predicted unusual protein kinase regulating ubiquinone biosynthesis (AarF/ABC1/UbiB family)
MPIVRQFFLITLTFKTLLFATPVFANPWKELFDKQLLKYQSDGAELLDRKESPALYGLIEEVQRRLNEALNSTSHSKKRKKVLEGVYVLQAPTHTLAAETVLMPASKADDGNDHYAVFISTDFIKNHLFRGIEKATKEEKEELLTKGVKGIIGALGHEAAHHSEMLEIENSTNSHYLNRAQQQMLEARTDVVSIDLLRRSSFPRDSMLRALQAVSRLEQENEHDLNENLLVGLHVTSTHPAGNIRNLISKEATLFDAFKNGDYLVQPILTSSAHRTFPSSPSALVSDPSQLESELVRMNAPTKPFIRNAPKSLEEAFANLEKSLRELPVSIPNFKAPASKVCPFYLAERNLDWIYSWMHNEIQIGKLIDQKRFLANAKDYFAKMPAIRDWKSGPDDCKELSQYATFPPLPGDRSEYIESIPFLRSEEYLDAVIQESHSHDQTEKLIENSSEYLPSPLRAKVYNDFLFPDRILAADRLMSRVKETATKRRNIELDYLAKSHLLDVLGSRIHEMNPADFESILKSQWANQNDRKSLLADILTLEFLNDERTRERLSKDSKAQEQIKKIAEFLFKHRGYLGALELSQHLTSFARTDEDFSPKKFNWLQVFKALNISEERGKKKIEAECVKYLHEMDGKFPPLSPTAEEPSGGTRPKGFYFSSGGKTQRQLAIKKKAKLRALPLTPEHSKMPLLTRYFSTPDGRKEFDSLGGSSSRSSLDWDGPEIAAYLTDRFNGMAPKEIEGPANSVRSHGVYQKAFNGMSSVQNEVINAFKRRLDHLLKEKGTNLDRNPELVTEVWHQVVNEWIPSLKRMPYVFPNTMAVSAKSPEGWAVQAPDLHLNLHLAQWVRDHAPQSSRKAIFERLLKNREEQSCALLSADMGAIREIMRESHVLVSFSSYYQFLYHSIDNLVAGRCRELKPTGDLGSYMGLGTQKHFFEDLFRIIDQELSHELEKMVSSDGSTLKHVVAAMRAYLNPPRIGGEEKRTPTEGPTHTQAMQTLHALGKTKKTLVDFLLLHPESEDEIIDTFELLTASGSTRDTDRYLRVRLSQFSGLFEKTPSKKFRKKLEEWITPNMDVDPKSSYAKTRHPTVSDLTRIGSNELRQQLFQYELKSIENAFPKPDLSNIMARLHHVFPDPSQEKNKILEEIAWKMKIDSKEALKKEIEPHKWIRTVGEKSKASMPALSFIAELCPKLDSEKRMRTLIYIANPTPETKIRFQDILDEQPELRELGNFVGNLGNDSGFSSSYEGKDPGYKVTNFMTSFIHQSSPMERLPVIDLLLTCTSTAEPNPLERQPKAIKVLMNELLGYSLKSTKGKILKAYLDSSSSDEHSSILAYLFSHSGEGDGGLRSIFELFSSVGIKAGQLASIWNLFEDPMVREDLEKLKDQAQPLDKIEVLDLLHKNLYAEEFKKVRRVARLMGCASIKCVVELENKDGTHTVAAIRRPNAIPVARLNLSRAKAFLNELAKDSEFAPTARLMESLLSSSARELSDELDFDHDMQQVSKAGTYFGTSKVPLKCARGKRVKLGVGDWKMEVPQYLPTIESPTAESNLVSVGTVPHSQELNENERRPQIRIMEFANGVSFDRLPEGTSEHRLLKEQAGKAIVVEALSALLSVGFMNSDPHKGNFIVNPVEKVIYPIDFGQSIQLSVKEGEIAKDDRSHLIRFLLSIHSEHKNGILGYGMQMTDQKKLTASQKVELEKKLAAATTIQDAVQSFLLSGLTFERKYFGVLKGLAILQKENYVKDEKTLIDLVQSVASEKMGLMDKLSFAMSLKGSPSVECIPDLVDIEAELGKSLSGDDGCSKD